MRYAALLRGINVGGNNRVPMADLRTIAADLGWTGATTYINSGNLVFDSPRTSGTTLAHRLEHAIEEKLAVRCRALVLGAPAIREIATAIPPEWANDTDRKTDVVYLLDGISPADALATLEPRAGIDHTVTTPGALIWMVGRKDATRSRLQRIVGTPLYQQSTVRNANTARKLAALVDA